MVEKTNTGWLTVLEKKGLRPETDILENYGIGRETDVSLFDPDDLNNLESQGLKPMKRKELERWCEPECSRDENMLTSSLNHPVTVTLLGSETLTVMTLPVDSTTTVESLSDNDRYSHSLTNEPCSSRVSR